MEIACYTLNQELKRRLKETEDQLKKKEEELKTEREQAYSLLTILLTKPPNMSAELEELNVELQDVRLEKEQLRRRLHDTNMELKGNIRVFCRVRPRTSDDGVGNEAEVVSFPGSMEEEGRAICLTQNGVKHKFTFNRVFKPEESQETVFAEISEFVQSALDGKKVCIFAYGQTGSGKTYTMMGNPGVSDQKGLIPRSLEQVFKSRQSLEAQGWKYEMKVSMLEIYNKAINDLLLPANRSGFDASQTENAGKKCAITGLEGNTSVSNLTIVEVHNSKEVSDLFERALQRRSVGKTRVNEQSSKSHFVFTLRIEGTHERAREQVQGQLNLIDLAGSERVSESGAAGDRMAEAKAINTSLSALGDVIYSLAKGQGHIPFRNSKLTHLLQPCLGRDSKTLMFVNVSPDPSSAGESLFSLEFAERANAVSLAAPRLRKTNLRSQNSRLTIG